MRLGSLALALLFALSATRAVGAPPAAGQATRRLLQAMGERGVIVDPSLTQAARHHAHEVLADEGAASLDRVRRALAKEGLADTQVVPFASVGPDPEALLAAAEAFVGSRVKGRAMNQLGLAIEGHGERWALVALFVRRLVELAPLPREVRPPSFRVRGRAAVAGLPLRAYLTGPDGEVTRLEVARKGTQIAVDVPIEGPGGYAFELLAEANLGPEVAALWRFSTPGATTDDRAAPKPESPSRAPREALYALIAEARAVHGREPVARQPALELAAAAHAKAVCAARLAAHVLPGGKPPDRRARDAGYEGPVAENIAIAASLEEAHANLLASPSHRLNLIDPRARTAGAGVESQHGSWCVVELFGLAE